MRRLVAFLVVGLVGLISVAGQVRAGDRLPAAVQAYAGLAQGDEFLISTPSRAEHDTPAVAYDDDLDQYLVVWADGRSDPLFPDIYGQLFSAEGVPLGDNLVIETLPSHALVYPDVAYDTVNERYVVVWQDSMSYNIEARVLLGDGTPAGLRFFVADGFEETPRLVPAIDCYAHATEGVCTVAYMRGSTAGYDVYSQRVSSQGVGVTLGPEQPVSDQSGDQVVPDVAVNPESGDFLIVWNNLNVSPASIRGRVQARDGALGGGFVVSSSTSVGRYDPAVAFSPDQGEDGEWLVLFWRDISDDTQIAGRQVAAAGGATGDLLHICNEAGNQFYPDLVYNSQSKEYLAVWADDRAGGTDLSIYGQRLDRSAGALGSSFRIGTASGSVIAPPMMPAVAASASSYVVVYDAPDGHPRGQRLAADGALQGSEFVIAAPLEDQTRHDVA